MKDPNLVKAFTAARVYIKDQQQKYICYAIWVACRNNEISVAESTAAIEVIRKKWASNGPISKTGLVNSFKSIDVNFSLNQLKCMNTGFSGWIV